MNKTFGKFEYIIFSMVILLTVFGLLMLYSASSIYSLKRYDSEAYLFMKQMIFVAIGFFTMLFISFVPYKIYMPFVKYIFIICFIVVVLTTFAGRISRGSSRWIEFKGIVFQPSEPMKLSMILYLSKVLATNIGKFDNKEVFMKVVAIAYVPTFIIALTNLSTGIILWTISTFMIFIVSNKKFIYIYLLTLIIGIYLFAYPVAKVLYNVGLLKQYQVGRIFAWKAPEDYPDLSYQTLQGLYAIGSGKTVGRGYLSSIQKSLIPEAQNDMIYSIICEEIGFVGAMLFIILYMILIFRLFYIAYTSFHLRDKLILFGITIHIAVQVFFNIGVVTNLLPNTGVTLPFVSYGGSSLLVLFVEIGIVLSIVRYSVRNNTL